MAANKNDYISDKRLYMDKDGNLVDEKDPARHTLVVAAGGSIPRERAVELGLVGEEAAPESSAPESESESTIDAKEESARVQGKKSTKKGK